MHGYVAVFFAGCMGLIAPMQLIRIEENQHEEQERGIADYCGDIGLDGIDFGGDCANWTRSRNGAGASRGAWCTRAHGDLSRGPAG